MATKKKKLTNPVLDSCANFIEKENSIRKQKSAQQAIIIKAQKEIDVLNLRQRAQHKIVCKELADEILSRDLQLDDTERDFLTMRLGKKKSSKEPSRSLLEILIDRKRHNSLFVYREEYEFLYLSKMQKVIDYADEKVFIKNLNKKLSGILRIILKRKVYNREYLKRLKRIPSEKIALEIEFIYSTSEA